MKNSQMHKHSIQSGMPGLVNDNDFNVSMLPGALVRTILEKWLIVPISAHSRFASLTRSCLAAPSNNPEDVARWSLKYRDCNWGVATGRASNLVILEVSRGNGQESPSELCCERWEGRTNTLKFQDAAAYRHHITA